MPSPAHTTPTTGASDGSRSRARAAGIAALILVLLLLAGGALLVFGGTWPFGERSEAQHQDPTPTLDPDTPVELVPDGTAEDNLPFFTKTLQDFAAGTEPVQGVPIVNAVAAAGFDTGAMQVSFDRTQTNLVADNIFVSVRIGGDCLIGQVVTADRQVTTVVEPAVGPDASLCLIGNTRAIDW